MVHAYIHRIKYFLRFRIRVRNACTGDSHNVAATLSDSRNSVKFKYKLA